MNWIYFRTTALVLALIAYMSAGNSFGAQPLGPGDTSAVSHAHLTFEQWQEAHKRAMNEARQQLAVNKETQLGDLKLALVDRGLILLVIVLGAVGLREWLKLWRQGQNAAHANDIAELKTKNARVEGELAGIKEGYRTGTDLAKELRRSNTADPEGCKANSPKTP